MVMLFFLWQFLIAQISNMEVGSLKVKYCFHGSWQHADTLNSDVLLVNKTLQVPNTGLGSLVGKEHWLESCWLWVGTARFHLLVQQTIFFVL